MIVVYRRFMVEVYGWISMRCLLRIVRHAVAVLDYTTADAARSVVQRGFECGWDGSEESKLTPQRKWWMFL